VYYYSHAALTANTLFDAETEMQSESTTDMKSLGGPIALITCGVLVSLGPVLGIMGTIVGMIHAFGSIAQSSSSTPEALASDISTSLWSTVVGFIVTPLGLGMVIGGILWLVRVSKQNSIEQCRRAVSVTRGTPPAGQEARPESPNAHG
jgi:hypothetical protein